MSDNGHKLEIVKKRLPLTTRKRQDEQLIH